MTLIAPLPVLCALIGLLIYGLTSHKHVGLIAFGCGLLVFLWHVSSRTIHL